MWEHRNVVILPFLSVVLLSNTLLALPGSDVKQSNISNVNENVTTVARDGSNVNTGVQIKGSTVRNSEIDNKFTGNIKASGGSTVNTGVKANGAVINKAEITTDTKANINAYRSDVNTGVNLTGVDNAEISTKVRAGEINASNSSVRVGSVEGDVSNKKIGTSVSVGTIDAENRNFAIGSVKSDDYGGGGIPASKGGSGGGRAAVSIGNVTVEAPQVREVKTTVGSGGFIDNLKTQHKAKVYKEEGGVDPTGTKNVFVSAKERAKVEKYGGSVGDTHVDASDYKVKKVKTVVE
jgi:hypothetical protein